MGLVHFSVALLLAVTAITPVSVEALTASAIPPESSAAAPGASAGGSLSPFAAMLKSAMAAYDAGDYRHARAGFLGLADQGSAIAETMLGVIYGRGQGVAPDPATAAGYWLRAGNRGYAPAQLAFARALASGSGVTRDPESAWLWASLAARGGDVAVAQQASGLAMQLQRGFTAAQAAALARRLAGWRPWMAG